jgi:polar amino acid transport system substrate-binding protein
VKQILQNVRSGALELVEVPAPIAGPGQVLVRNAFSVMSPGTEKLSLEFARKTLLGKARSRPDLVKQVLGKLRRDGPLATYRTVTSRLEGPQPLGYASAGVVLAAGEGVTGFAPGDEVACAGAGYANHAELVVVPENLCVRVPAGVPLQSAAFATIGAIALQGLRVAAPTLGEVVAVIGLGLIGQLTVMLARVNGCRVLGVDLDPTRVAKARELGAEWGGDPRDDLSPWRARAADGYGADFAVITASADDASPLALAASLCRQKGRISLVGAVPIEVERRALYDKELELRMSMSYGPGRYDRNFEETGLDYPISYVRWTENRNLAAFLQLIAARALDIARLDTDTVAFEDSVRTYDDLAQGRRRSLAAVFRYDAAPRLERTLTLAAPRAKSRERVGVALIGAGNYAKAVLLPALPKSAVRRWLIASSGPSARASATRFGFEICGTSLESALADANVDLVIVATRHDSHAAFAAAALRADKAVWVEKPVALSEPQLAELEGAARATGGFLSVGYNRRFSSHARAIRAHFSGRSGPLAIHYVISAGPPPTGSWITDRAIGGGRIVGEVCHFVDLCAYLVGSPPSSVFARALGRDPDRDDSTTVLLSFADGSVATIEYLAHAESSLPKERLEVSGDGRTARCEDFRATELLGGGRPRRIRGTGQDKGQEAALREVVDAVRSGAPSPFLLPEIFAIARATLAIEASARSGRALDVVTPR